MVDHPADGLWFLVDTGLADQFLPELPNMRLEHDHPKIDDHVFQVSQECMQFQRVDRKRISSREVIGHKPNRIIAEDKDIRRVMELLEAGSFNSAERGIFDILIAGLRNPHDQWLTIADFRSYIDTQELVGQQYTDQELWNRKSIINCATSGWFSSDRTISQYADEIWNVCPVGKN